MATSQTARTPVEAADAEARQDLGRVPGVLDEGEIAEVRYRLNCWLEEKVAGNGRTVTAAAKRIGMSAATISWFAQGKYQGDNEKLARRVAAFLGEEARLALHPPDPAYRENRFTKVVTQGLRHAHESCDVSVIYGNPGLGKTEAIRNYVRQHPSAILVTCNPTIRGDRGLLEELVAVLRLRPKTTTGRAFFNALVVALKGSRRLLIVDEAQHLTTTVVNILRALHDETAIGLVLCGNEEVWGRMETVRGVVRAPFAQLRDRVGFRRHLRLPPEREEVKEIATQILPKLDRTGVDYLHQQALRTGSFRIVTKHCTWVAKRLNGTGRSPTLEDLRQATGVVA
jgi:hypothetical protein